MNEQEAREIIGSNMVGTDELRSLGAPFSYSSVNASDVPFSQAILEQHGRDHLLIFAPKDPLITINWFRREFGVDPKKEPCMYDQDWYLKENFATKMTLDGTWHLLQKSVREDMRGKTPDDIQQTLHNETFPSAILCTFAFFVWQLLKKEVLWKHDFLWCSDLDHNGDRIYVGRYEDPEGMNKQGFNIHRHLSLRRSYSTALEISQS